MHKKKTSDFFRCSFHVPIPGPRSSSVLPMGRPERLGLDLLFLQHIGTLSPVGASSRLPSLGWPGLPPAWWRTWQKSRFFAASSAPGRAWSPRSSVVFRSWSTVWLSAGVPVIWNHWFLGTTPWLTHRLLSVQSSGIVSIEKSDWNDVVLGPLLIIELPQRQLLIMFDPPLDKYRNREKHVMFGMKNTWHHQVLFWLFASLWCWSHKFRSASSQIWLLPIIFFFVSGQNLGVYRLFPHETNPKYHLKLMTEIKTQ